MTNNYMYHVINRSIYNYLLVFALCLPYYSHKDSHKDLHDDVCKNFNLSSLPDGRLGRN